MLFSEKCIMIRASFRYTHLFVSKLYLYTKIEKEHGNKKTVKAIIRFAMRAYRRKSREKKKKRKEANINKKKPYKHFLQFFPFSTF